ncbi:hypothetical protein GGR92_000005 [Spirosoma lacussanchae]|uniref:hypothetical protein n=1 Tax=Spirosoma lacussanchae TaxID=1884249 RepID=UPI0011098725|nr:hypothetical protein [Spirosoma lacussanchae]
MNPNLFADRIAPDVVIFVMLFAGSLARLIRGESLAPLKALSELIYGMVIGACTTGAIIHLSGLPLLSGWWVAGICSFFSSLIVSIVEKKGEQLRDLSPGATVKLIFREVLAEIKKFKTPEPPGPNV